MPINSLFVQLEFSTPDGKTADNYQNVVTKFFEFGGAASSRKMMVIWAQPGQGKTTLVKKICYDWSRTVDGESGFTICSVNGSNAYIAHIELLLVCSLREVRENSKSILEMCLSSHPDDLSELEAWIDANPTKFLVILDGFDELQPPTRCAQLNSMFSNLRSIPPFPIIVTSRPAALENKKHLFYPTQIRGLVVDELPKFVANYCTDVAKRGRVLEYLNKNPHLVERLFKCPFF